MRPPVLSSITTAPTEASKPTLARAAALAVTVAAAAATAAAALCLSVYAPEALGTAARPCSGKHVYPSMSLPSVAKNAPAGTTFCLHDGTYRISSPVPVQSGDVFAGVYSDPTRPHILTNSARFVFSAGKSRGATIRDLKVSGAVGDDSCEPDCGRGIDGGRDLTVLRVRASNNMNSGIGSTGPGLLVEDSVIDRNGSPTFTRFSDGPSSSAGIKSVNSFTVVDSWIHHNLWNGVWCDGECNAFTVKGSTITDNGKAGVHYEVSTGPALIANNVIQRNGWNEDVPTRRAGLLIVDSQHVEAYGNIFGSNDPRGILVGDSLERLPAVFDVSIHDNTMNGDNIVGCDRVGVTCSNNK